MSVLDTKIQLNGSCFCGLVTFTVSGRPIRRAYCHCTLCQQLSASPFVHTVHYSAASFQWTHLPPVTNRLDTFDVPSKPWKTRYRCKVCGSNIASHNTKTDRWSVWGPTLERDPEGKIIGWDIIAPTAHMFYGTRIMDINDGLGKWDGYEDESARIG